MDPATQQRALAAEQLNNSGIYLLKKNDYAGAINEFQQALNQAPNDANILSNLKLAKLRQRDAANAARNSNALGSLLGTTPSGLGNVPGALPSPLNLVNLDPNVVDFRGIAHTSSANPNSSFLNTVITGSDSNTVDLGSGRIHYVDPKSLKGQINDVLGNPIPGGLTSPQKQIEKLFQEPQSEQPSSGSRVATPETEQQLKTKVNTIFSGPAPSSTEPHN